MQILFYSRESKSSAIILKMKRNINFDPIFVCVVKESGNKMSTL